MPSNKISANEAFAKICALKKNHHENFMQKVFANVHTAIDIEKSSVIIDVHNEPYFVANPDVVMNELISLGYYCDYKVQGTDRRFLIIEWKSVANSLDSENKRKNTSK